MFTVRLLPSHFILNILTENAYLPPRESKVCPLKPMYIQNIANARNILAFPNNSVVVLLLCICQYIDVSILVIK